MVPVESAEGNGGNSGSSASPLSGAMTFIDFEYSERAPRGFDWGNHFCE